MPRLPGIPVFTTVFTALAVSPGCAPAVVAMTMPNPARAGVMTQATQAYEIPPFKEEHRYEVTLAGWTPSTVEFRIHLLNAESCGLPSSYFIDLVDDHERQYPFHARGAEHPTPIPGHLGARLLEATIDGDVSVPVGERTRYVILKVRPKNDRACTALDFRWDFQG